MDHRLAVRPLMTGPQLAREPLEDAARSRDPVQFPALRRRIDGASFAELGLANPRDADKPVRAALARLRRPFGDQADE